MNFKIPAMIFLLCVMTSYAKGGEESVGILFSCDPKIGAEKCATGQKTLQAATQSGLLTDDVIKYTRKVIVGTQWRRGWAGTQEVPFDFKTSDLIENLASAAPGEDCDMLGFGFSYIDYVPGTSVVSGPGGIYAGSITLGSGNPNVKSVVLVWKVLPHFAAYRAGLRPGDVITQINQTEIQNTEQLKAFLASQNPPYALKVTGSAGPVTIWLREREKLCDFSFATAAEMYVNSLL